MRDNLDDAAVEAFTLVRNGKATEIARMIRALARLREQNKILREALEIALDELEGSNPFTTKAKAACREALRRADEMGAG